MKRVIIYSILFFFASCDFVVAKRFLSSRNSWSYVGSGASKQDAVLASNLEKVLKHSIGGRWRARGGVCAKADRACLIALYAKKVWNYSVLQYQGSIVCTKTGCEFNFSINLRSILPVCFLGKRGVYLTQRARYTRSYRIVKFRLRRTQLKTVGTVFTQSIRAALSQLIGRFEKDVLRLKKARNGYLCLQFELKKPTSRPVK